jgi:hypothetical protein
MKRGKKKAYVKKLLICGVFECEVNTVLYIIQCSGGNGKFLRDSN